MSEHHKTRVFTQDRKDLKIAISTAGLDIRPTATLNAADSEFTGVGVTGSRGENGVHLAMAGQNPFTERLEQTRGLEAERRAAFSISKAW